MSTILTDLFVNMCVLGSLIFIYLQIRVKLKLEQKNRFVAMLVDGFAGGLLGYFLMFFSIHVSTETMVDLRYLPVMLLIIFIGVPQAVISAVLIILTRFIFGFTTSAIAAMILMTVLILGFVVIHKLCKSADFKKNAYKQSFLMVIFSNIVFSIIISYLVTDAAVLKSLILGYWMVSTIGGLSSVMFVGYIRKTQFLLMKYEKDSTTDFLTGLNNVRQFDSVWNMLISNATEKKERLSLLMIDIDHFKHVNDTYGHPIGDKILFELGQVLKNGTRSFDVVSRNGGEEFSVILPDCPHQQAIEIAERIRRSVELHRFQISPKEEIQITVSIGVATYPETVKDTVEIVDVADDCLYTAKRTGRNRICPSYITN
ncbi:MAG: diguanylate cyclase [Planococcus sp. (in: firmicutes)]